ncbi:hypothetical protein HGRIS_013112 [Hohenbuehelia grisea]
MKSNSKFVGLSIHENKVYTCTSNGALRVCTPQNSESDDLDTQVSVLPTRLTAWQLSPDGRAFAYGGDEVEVSVWDTERAFSTPVDAPQKTENSGMKRKRNDQLLPSEIWRAKNVANDSLGLRQPVRVSSVAWLSSSSSSHQILAGTEFGDLRRYDSRAARKPVFDWKVCQNGGGIKTIQKGFSEHEVFVSDTESRLMSVDLRNGRTNYGYKGIAGAVNSVAVSPSILCSTALDRIARIHSTFPPPTEAGQQQEQKGAVLEKVFTKALPTVVLWDQDATVSASEEPQEDDVWENMERADDTDDEDNNRKRSKK